MATAKERPIIHYYQTETGRILCGVTDPSAHWTIRSGVTCPRCLELLAERGHPYAGRRPRTPAR